MPVQLVDVLENLECESDSDNYDDHLYHCQIHSKGFQKHRQAEPA